MTSIVEGRNGIRIPILCYHSSHAGDSYANDDHLALEADLRAIYALGFKVVPLDWIVEALLGEREASEGWVGLTCDDGLDLDWLDAVHPTFGERRSFANIIRQFSAEAGTLTPPIEMTSFVVASPATRKELEVTCLAGLDWWNDSWWKSADQSGVIRIESHSFDHVHPMASRVAQREQRKGDFALVETRLDCEMQVGVASRYIAHKTGRMPRYFAYPYGQASAYLRGTYLPEQGPQLGLRAAFSIDHAYVTQASDRWFLPRFTHGASDNSSPQDLERILLGSTRHG